jgi:hypothetical protein
MNPRNETLLPVLALVVVVLGALAWISRPADPGPTPMAAGLGPAGLDDPRIPEGARVRGPGGDPSFTFAGQTFSVPEPGDREWEDYQAMLRHPRVRSSVQDAPGYRIPYDPEWRTLITGRRVVAPNDLPVVGGAGDVEGLARAVLTALHAKDAARLLELGVEEEQWKEVYWPAFPQSRPYLKIPVEEVWDLHRAENRSGVDRMLRELSDRDLVLESTSHGAPERYTNFTLLPDLRIRAVDASTGEIVEIDQVKTLALRQGRYKVYMYSES